MGRFSLAMARLHQDFGLLFQGFGIRHFLSAIHCFLNSTLPCTSLVIPKQTMLHWRLILDRSVKKKIRVIICCSKRHRKTQWDVIKCQDRAPYHILSLITFSPNAHHIQHWKLLIVCLPCFSNKSFTVLCKHDEVTSWFCGLHRVPFLPFLS